MITSRRASMRQLDLENEVSPTGAQPPGTLFLPTSTTLLTPVHPENVSRAYFLIVLTTDYCWRSWTCRTAAPYKFHVDWLIEWLNHYRKCNTNHTSVSKSRTRAKKYVDLTVSTAHATYSPSSLCSIDCYRTYIFHASAILVKLEN